MVIIGRAACGKGSFEENFFFHSALKELIMCRGSVRIVCLYQNHCAGSQIVIEVEACCSWREDVNVDVLHAPQ